MSCQVFSFSIASLSGMTGFQRYVLYIGMVLLSLGLICICTGCICCRGTPRESPDPSAATVATGVSLLERGGTDRARVRREDQPHRFAGHRDTIGGESAAS